MAADCSEIDERARGPGSIRALVFREIESIILSVLFNNNYYYRPRVAWRARTPRSPPPSHSRSRPFMPSLHVFFLQARGRPDPIRRGTKPRLVSSMSATTAGNNWWASAKLAANAAAAKTRVAAGTAKLRAEMALIDREINGRKKQFGVEMYDQMSPLISSVDFYTGPMYDDEQMTELVRPLLIQTHKEVAALEAKVSQLKEDVSAAEVGRTSAFGAQSTTVQDKFKKAGKTVASAGVEGKLKAELRLVQNKITATKQEMGIELFGQFALLEDRENWLPKDRVVRGIYDSCRQDMEAIELKRRQKQQELAERGFNG